MIKFMHEIFFILVSPLIAYSDPHVETVVGRTIQLTCKVLLGNPPPVITWLKMGEVVPTDLVRQIS